MNTNTIKATWKNGQVVLDSSADWPEGSRLIILEEPATTIEFMTEEEQSDDPVAIQRWIDDLRAIPAVPQQPLQETEQIAWQEKVKEFNVEAVRHQMEKGIPCVAAICSTP
jgi:hypothetical protein